MSSGTYALSASTRVTWAARAMSWLTAGFILIDGAMKVIAPSPVVEAMHDLGYAERFAPGIGILAIAVVAVYLYSRTAVLGAVLLTGFLGGAVASQVRAEADLFPIIFPIVLGALLWTGLCLRDERARAIFQLRS